jgi:asparagine synthase (glutamine-hydrolysing)
MAVSLEARVPLLDHRLAEYVNGLPASYKITRSRGKVLLRDIVGHHVPAGFFERPKTGFSIPLRSWLTGPWESAATSLFAEAPEGMFDERGVSRLMDLLRHSDRDLSRPVWGLLSLARWSSRERASLPW